MKLYDPKCYDLAASFLDDVPGSTDVHRRQLAAAIQTTIEDFIEDEWKQPEIAGSPASVDESGSTPL